jgi:uncharacterized membrane protein YqjE
MAEGAASRGPLGALRNIAATLLASAHTRLALLGNELQIEKHLALRQFVLALALLFCGGMALILCVGLLLLLWWDQRLWLLGGLALGFSAVTALLYTRLSASTRRAEPVFAASLAELKEDLRQLKAASAHGQKPD